MARLSISNAARVTGVSRVTLHRYIKAGKLSRTPDGAIDTAELLRIGLTLHADTVTNPVTAQHPVTPSNTLPVPPNTPALERLLDTLQQQLADARAREQVAQEREAILLQMLQQVQQQHQRVLDAPRTTFSVPPTPPPGARPDTTGPGSGPALQPHPGTGPRGAIRRQIVALLRDHPDGLTPAQMRRVLGVEKSLANTALAMLRDGLLQRLGHGRYMVAQI